MNYTVVEMDENYSKTRYCGVWLYNNPAKECIDVAPNTFHRIMENHTHLLPQEDQIKRMKERVAGYTTEQVLVYCNGCERGIRLGEGRPTHIVELLAERL